MGALGSGRRVLRRPLPYGRLVCGGTPHPLHMCVQQIGHPNKELPFCSTPNVTPVCNKYFYNFGAKYSRFRHWPPMGMRKHRFSVISATVCNSVIYTPCIISSSPQTLQKATEAASFCLKTCMNALRKWGVCAPQLHELSPKSGAFAPQNPHVRPKTHAICHCRASKTRFSKVKINSRNRCFSPRVCNVVGDMSCVVHCRIIAWCAVRHRTHYIGCPI